MPVTWIGLAAWAVLPATRAMRVAGALFVAAVVLTQGRFALAMATNWPTDANYAISRDLREFRARIPAGERIAFTPGFSYLMGNYYDMPIDMILQTELRKSAPARREPILDPAETETATWLLGAKVDSPAHVEAAKRDLAALTKAYGHTLDDAEVARHILPLRFFAIRIDRQRIAYFP
jgi:hypothetical protein